MLFCLVRLSSSRESLSPPSIASSVSSAISSTSASATQEPESTTSSDVDAASPSKQPTSEEQIANAREKIASDLKNWQDKFAQAADKGTEDLEERVKEITDRQIESQAHGMGRALVFQLEEESSSQIQKLKSQILKVVNSLSEDIGEAKISRSEEDISQAVKDAGIALREKAQALRSWRQKYDEEIDSLVSAAAQSTLDVLDNISSLGLQEIGMRWAWMDGVTYKDWSKYHEVRKNFDQWTLEVEAVAKEHPGIQKAQEAGKDIESSGMAVAESTAKELTRLKDVGRWKIEALDSSDDFSTKHIPPKAANVGHKVMDRVQSASEKFVSTPQGTAESLSSKARVTVVDGASSASSVALGTEPGMIERASSRFSEASSSASKGVTSGTPAPVYDKAASAVTEGLNSASKVFGGALAQKVGDQKPVLDDLVDDDTTYSEKLQSLADQAGDKYADLTKVVSEALLGPTSIQDSVARITSLPGDQYSSALAAASSALYGASQGTAASVSSVASSKYAEAIAA